jgi:putative cardiolipin synthase
MSRMIECALMTSIPRAIRRFAFKAAALALFVAIAGCSALPPNPVRPPSTAIAPGASTPLGAIVAASSPDPALSGFRLEPLAWYAFRLRLELAARAQRTLDVQYYVLHNDDTGKALFRALRDAADRGVRVRLLLDDLYTSGEDELLFALAASSPNVEVRLFNPFPGGRASFVGRFASSLADFSRVNHRMHNKLMVADNAMAVAGGRNIADEYFMRANENNFVDLDVLATGPVVHELSTAFDTYWNSEYVYPIGSLASYPGSPAAQRAKLDTLTAAPEWPRDTGVPERLKRYTTTLEQLEQGRLELTAATAHAFADPPDKVAGSKDATREGTVRARLVEAMRAAREEVFVASPYFVPGQIGLESMQQLRARQVRLRLLTNSLAATDEPLVHTGYTRYRTPMLQAGVEIHELSPGLSRQRSRLGRFGASFGRLHAKIAVIDHRILFVGSMNLDNRSERRNTELGLLIDSPALASELLGMMDFESSAYLLRLAPDGHSTEWVTRQDGTEKVLTEEPEAGALLRLQVFLLAPIVPEGEL